MTALLTRLRPVLTLVALLVTFTSLALVCSRPSVVRQGAQRVTTVPDEPQGGIDLGGEVVGEDSESAETPSTPGRATRRRAGTTASGASAAVAPLVTGLGPGITADAIKLGFIVVSNNDRLLSNYGVKGGRSGIPRIRSTRS